MPSCPTAIDPQEALGRAIFDSKHADNAKKGKIPPKVFQEQAGILELSVDRLLYVEAFAAAEIQTRLRGRSCRGWAVVDAAAASKNGRSVVSTPILPLQPHHADIVLPPCKGEEMFIVQKTHAVELAMSASWRAAP